MKNQFVAAVTCMDGRIQSSINAYLREKYSVPFVDVISEPGPNKILADKKDQALIDSIKLRLDISVNKHGSKVIALVGHEDCAGNPESKEVQQEDTIKGLEVLAAMGFPATIIGLWVNLAGEVELIKEMKVLRC